MALKESNASVYSFKKTQKKKKNESKLVFQIISFFKVAYTRVRKLKLNETGFHGLD